MRATHRDDVPVLSQAHALDPSVMARIIRSKGVEHFGSAHTTVVQNGVGPEFALGLFCGALGHVQGFLHINDAPRFNAAVMWVTLVLFVHTATRWGSAAKPFIDCPGGEPFKGHFAPLKKLMAFVHHSPPNRSVAQGSTLEHTLRRIRSA